MGGWLAALATLARPIVARVLIALGMSVVSIAGVEASIMPIKGLIVSYMGAGPVAALQLAGMAGCWTALGTVLGAMTFSVTYWALTQSVKVLGVGGA